MGQSGQDKRQQRVCGGKHSALRLSLLSLHGFFLMSSLTTPSLAGGAKSVTTFGRWVSGMSSSSRFFLYGSWPVLLLYHQANACAANSLPYAQLFLLLACLSRPPLTILQAQLLSILRSLSSRLHREDRGSTSADELPLHFFMTLHHCLSDL